MSPLYFSIGLAAPWWAMLLLLFVWAGLLMRAVFIFKEHPFQVLGFPFVAAAVWIVVLLVGSQMNWTA